MACTRLAVAPSHTSLAAAAEAVTAHRLWLSPCGPKAYVELRLDRMVDADPASLRWAVRKLGAERVIVTYRSLAEGGGLHGAAVHDLAARTALLNAARALGVAYVDVELASVKADVNLRSWLTDQTQLCAGKPPLWVASCHHLGPMPAAAHMADLAQQAAELGAAAFKMVAGPTGGQQQAAFAAWSHGSQPLPTLAIALGAEGLWSRLLVGRQRQPGPYTLVRLDDDPGLAPGQPTWEQADSQYQLWRVGAQTAIFGVVGSPIGHSRSPALHARAIAENKLDAIYLPFEVPGPLSAWLSGLGEILQVRGLSVTAPHKTAALKAAHFSSPAGQAAGAINTLWRPAHNPRHWHGANTDGAAAAASLGALFPESLAGRRVLVLGAGGAARAAAWGMTQQQARVAVWARRSAAASALCADLQDHVPAPYAPTFVPADSLHQALGHCDAVVHCTPVGMLNAPAHHERLLDDRALRRLPQNAVVFDTVYAPAVTPLLAAAARLHCRTLGGADMLERQALGQMQLFYKAEPSGRPG